MIKAGNLTFETYPIAFFPDWRKTLRFDWRRLQRQFNHVATYDCRPPKTLPTLPKKIEVGPHIMSTARTPLGQPKPQALAARMARMVKASGFKTEQDFLLSIDKQFPYPKAKIDVPVSEILRGIDRNYRQIIGYWREDRYILMVPRGRNPQGDFMILCLPDQISWAIYTVGICGIERKERETFPSAFSGEFFSYVFEASGPYKKVFPPRYVPATDIDLSKPFDRHDVKEEEKNDFWRKLEKKDRLQRKKSLETGKPPGADYGWLREGSTGGGSHDKQRRDAEMKRISKKYG